MQKPLMPQFSVHYILFLVQIFVTDDFRNIYMISNYKIAKEESTRLKFLSCITNVIAEISKTNQGRNGSEVE